MTRVFDNINEQLDAGLRSALASGERTDIAVGFFNLRGWRLLADVVDGFAGGDRCARVLVGMQQLPQDELRDALSLDPERTYVDQRKALKMRRQAAEEFRDQLMLGLPTESDRRALRDLSRQLRSGLVKVKLHLAHLLHAKLYLAHRPQDPATPIWAFVGSSNLTMAGLRYQGELNVDVTDDQAADALASWFEDRWNNRLSIDISEELADIIDDSWAREQLLDPYLIYLKIAYHVSQEARAGLAEYALPKDFRDILLPFQSAAVKIAARHLQKRGGVLLGDVVGLGKTLMATALARIMEDAQLAPRTLVICPPNLQRMWRDHVEDYNLNARVLSIGAVINELPELKRFPLIIVDESHNLRNREGKRYRVIRDYIAANDAKCILLSATPYNKSYHDLSAQLRLFVAEDEDLGLRPERALSDIGETEFARRHQCGLRTIAAFEYSEHADDWRDLMRLYLVRRTRSFIKNNYAETDPESGRQYLQFASGDRFAFPDRVPLNLAVPSRDDDPYAALYSQDVVDVINALSLPRYGLGNYIQASGTSPPTSVEAQTIEELGRAGRRLMGFCRTNLFKRLESSGEAFLLSVQRHVLRNRVVLHALDNELPIPIGAQEPRLWHPDEDDQDLEQSTLTTEDDSPAEVVTAAADAARAYEEFSTRWAHRFKWLSSHLFGPELREHLSVDIEALEALLAEHSPWDPKADGKLITLTELLAERHPDEKVLVFSQFADSVRYLGRELARAGIRGVETVDGHSEDPTDKAQRFSPRSNTPHGASFQEPSIPIRVLVSTDVLSEGQNLQDAAIVVNFDLPWAIVRLIQRAGRVDRIGQHAETIRCYSFEPAEGVEKIILLRKRVRTRLRESGEVLGTDEQFFVDAEESQTVDLYNERSGVLDDTDDEDVDLGSFAFEIWKQATKDNPKLRATVEELPDVVYSGKAAPEAGSLAFIRTAQDNDALVWLTSDGAVLSESPIAVLNAAACPPDTGALDPGDRHLDLVATAVRHAVREERLVGGGLGRPSGARFRAYERLKSYVEHNDGTLLVSEELKRAVEDIYRSPLRPIATDTINRQLRAGISDEELGHLVVELRADDRLVVSQDEDVLTEPRVVCSLGLVADG